MSLDKLIKEVEILVESRKGGVGSGNFGHEGVPGHLGGSTPKGGDSSSNLSNSIEESYNNAVSETRDPKKSLRKKYMAASGNNLTVKAAKQVAKEKKLKFQGILKLITPDNNISGDVTWDRNGNLGKVR